MLAAGVLGGALIGAAGGDGRGRVARVAGLALVGLAVRPMVVEMIRDIGDRRRQAVIRSSIEIERSVADVFAFFNDFENFPRVVGNLRSVTDYQDGRAHWEGYAPSGHLIEWDTVITKYVPRSVIAWHSTPESDVQMTSLIRFTALSATRVRVDFETTYYPPHTGIQDAIRALFGPALDKRLQEDLVRARDYLESIAPRAVASDEPAVDETKNAEAATATRGEGSPA
jgi:uncharacterized membrane protein